MYDATAVLLMQCLPVAWPVCEASKKQEAISSSEEGAVDGVSPSQQQLFMVLCEFAIRYI